MLLQIISLCTLCTLWNTNSCDGKRVYERKTAQFDGSDQVDIGSDFFTYGEDVDDDPFGKVESHHDRQNHTKLTEMKKRVSHNDQNSTEPFDSNELMRVYNESIRFDASKDAKIEGQVVNCTDWINLSIWHCWDTLQGENFIMLLLKLLLTLIIIIGLVASCLWCTKGWCCCCCPCNFCKVSKRLMEAQLYMAHNPPGVRQNNGKTLYYTPTDREVMLYEKITNYLVDI